MRPRSFPLAGSILMIQPSCQMFAQISPLIYSSSLSVHHRLAFFVEHDDRANRFKSFGIDDLITCVPSLIIKFVPSLRQTPAFAGVFEFFEQLEIVQIINKSGVFLPRQLVNFIVENRYSFTEILVGQIVFSAKSCRFRFRLF